ncbi:hypothetical protein BpPP18_15070 [Weizmannia acidilactici]|nr:hypothetical protein BpPP18_15070 [Weizmannia acidilactici]
MNDDEVNEIGKINFAYMMFVIDCPDVDIDTKIATVKAISEYIQGDEETGENDDSNNTKEYLSFEKDADYIFASFMQEYGIDLIEQQGKLRWEKFIALFNGMRSETKINQIIGIRAADLPTGNSPAEIAERNRLIELKDLYALDKEASVSLQEKAMDDMFERLVKSAQQNKK